MFHFLLFLSDTYNHTQMEMKDVKEVQASEFFAEANALVMPEGS